MGFAMQVLRSAALSFVCLAVIAPLAGKAALPPAPPPSSSFDIGILHVDRYGSGAQALILIPGLGGGPWVWYGTIAHFQSTYTIYALTLPGFDGRPPTKQTPLFTAFSDSFWKLLADQHIVHPIVIGHSIGGTLAILLGEEHPNRLRAIVAVDGLPVFPMLASATAEERQAAAARAAAQLASESGAAWLDSQTKYMASIGTLDPSLVAATAQLQAKSDPNAEAAWVTEDLTTDLRPDLPKETAPLLEIMPYNPSPSTDGTPTYTRDQTVAFYRSLLAGAPNAQVRAIVPSRHFVMLDQPDALYASIAGFIDSVPLR